MHKEIIVKARHLVIHRRKKVHFYTLLRRKSLENYQLLLQTLGKLQYFLTLGTIKTVTQR